MANVKRMCGLVCFINPIILHVLMQVSGSDINDVTNTLLPHMGNGQVAAFGDFDSDKVTDIFLISEGTKVYILLATKEDRYSRKLLVDISKHFSDAVVTSVVGGDFDGDSQMDVLVTCEDKPVTSHSVSIHIFWGTNKGQGVEEQPFNLTDKLMMQPLVMDYNADMLPDLFGELYPNGKRYCWLANSNRTFTPVVVETPPDARLLPMRKPHSNAFVDLNGDLVADLFVTTVDEANDKKQKFEIWLNDVNEGGWQLNDTISPPQKAGSDYKVVGQSAFTDINADRKMDQLLPVCMEEDCRDSKIYCHTNGEWYVMFNQFSNEDAHWRLAPPSRADGQPLTLRIGDFDMDGFPDVIAVLYREEKGTILQQAFVMYNVPCKDLFCKAIGRSFSVEWDSPLNAITSKVVTATFFDIYENGILDILLTTKENSGQYNAHAFLHVFSGDACFMKVTVVSGLCYEDCNGNSPYGSDQPGPTVAYMTIRTDGTTQKSIATQLSQSAYMALQLPFTEFGLGLSPNFVDSMEVGIPTPAGRVIRSRSWTSIIPNAQLTIIPYPPSNPSSWYNKLFISPMDNKQVLYTAAALIGTCGLVTIIAGVLHWRERAEDKKEKLVDAQKFHFDAM